MEAYPKIYINPENGAVIQFFHRFDVEITTEHKYPFQMSLMVINETFELKCENPSMHLEMNVFALFSAYYYLHSTLTDWKDPRLILHPLKQSSFTFYDPKNKESIKYYIKFEDGIISHKLTKSNKTPFTKGELYLWFLINSSE